jgi:hypothetical protein
MLGITRRRAAGRAFWLEAPRAAAARIKSVAIVADLTAGGK